MTGKFFTTKEVALAWLVAKGWRQNRDGVWLKGKRCAEVRDSDKGGGAHIVFPLFREVQCDNRPTMEERRLAKQAAWRAAQGLPPKGAKPTPARKPRRFDRQEDSYTADRIDGYDRDDLGLSPDC